MVSNVNMDVLAVLSVLLLELEHSFGKEYHVGRLQNREIDCIHVRVAEIVDQKIMVQLDLVAKFSGFGSKREP